MSGPVTITRETFSDVVEGNDITNRMRGRSCMMLGSSSAGRAVNTVVRRNTFHDCGALANDNLDHGLYASVTRGAQIVDPRRERGELADARWAAYAHVEDEHDRATLDQAREAHAID